MLWWHRAWHIPFSATPNAGLLLPWIQYALKVTGVLFWRRQHTNCDQSREGPLKGGYHICFCFFFMLNVSCYYYMRVRDHDRVWACNWSYSGRSFSNVRRTQALQALCAKVQRQIDPHPPRLIATLVTGGVYRLDQTNIARMYLWTSKNELRGAKQRTIIQFTSAPTRPPLVVVYIILVPLCRTLFLLPTGRYDMNVVARCYGPGVWGSRLTRVLHFCERLSIWPSRLLNSMGRDGSPPYALSQVPA